MSLWSEDSLETRKTGPPAQPSGYLVDPVRDCRDAAGSQLGVEHQLGHITLELICLSFDLHEAMTKPFSSGLKIFFFLTSRQEKQKGNTFDPVLADFLGSALTDVNLPGLHQKRTQLEIEKGCKGWWGFHRNSCASAVNSEWMGLSPTGFVMPAPTQMYRRYEEKKKDIFAKSRKSGDSTCRRKSTRGCECVL